MLLYGCLTPIDFPVERNGRELVVSAKLSTIPSQTIVSIGRTTELDRFPNPVIGAQVTVLDDQDNTWRFRHIGSGNYGIADFQPLPGATYRLQIVIDRKTYESLPQRMPDEAANARSYYEFRNEEVVSPDGTISSLPILDILSDLDIPPSRPFIRISTSEVYVIRPTNFPDPFNSTPPDCFVSSRVNSQAINLIDTRAIRSSRTARVASGSRNVDESFLLRHYFAVTAESCTPESFDYWSKVKVLVNQVGSIFDTPPAQLKGNIFSTTDTREVVWGFFEVVNASQSGFDVFPSDLPVFFPDPCPYIEGKPLFEYPTKCIDCLSVQGSSIIPPPWF